MRKDFQKITPKPRPIGRCARASMKYLFFVFGIWDTPNECERQKMTKQKWTNIKYMLIQANKNCVFFSCLFLKFLDLMRVNRSGAAIWNMIDVRWRIDSLEKRAFGAPLKCHMWISVKWRWRKWLDVPMWAKDRNAYKSNETNWFGWLSDWLTGRLFGMRAICCNFSPWMTNIVYADLN